MTHYYIVVAGGHQIDSYDENQKWYIKPQGYTNLNIQLGYDAEFVGYWLTIEDYNCPALELKDYIFHNVRDVPEIRMSFAHIEQKLAQFNVQIPYQLAMQLVLDGIEQGYLLYTNQNPHEKLRDFEAFYQRNLVSCPKVWKGERLSVVWKPT
ncbi:hypothetical protein [Dendronalium sp. ChiSLP03b]|uniref:hypothetical protein n=1 Tax=Dendronalium sp. ChiSLP03b TaxID=3075381 RepID=UPI002AD35015|nr:hypothetical protein [Dendronalium sp. ChiSLP03b]MDZ8208636.1 hypothetical protein [Dendronalium sp. ChiSLP03b]